MRGEFFFNLFLHPIETNVLLTTFGYLSEGLGCLRLWVRHDKGHSSVTIGDHFRVDGNPPKKGSLQVPGSFFSSADLEREESLYGSEGNSSPLIFSTIPITGILSIRLKITAFRESSKATS